MSSENTTSYRAPMSFAWPPVEEDTCKDGLIKNAVDIRRSARIIVPIIGILGNDTEREWVGTIERCLTNQANGAHATSQ